MSGDGQMLPPAGGGISDPAVAFAAELIDRSGKARSSRPRSPTRSG
jgi:hypothetical protein